MRVSRTYPARSVLTIAPEIGLEFEESMTCPSTLGLTGEVNGGTIMQHDSESALRAARRLVKTLIIFCTTSRPSTAGMEARIQTGTLPAVGCAVLLGIGLLCMLAHSSDTLAEKNPSRNGRTIRSQNATPKRATRYTVPIHAVVVGKCDVV